MMTEIMISNDWLRDVVYKLYSSGPKTDPCGTPNANCYGHDIVPNMSV